MDLHSELIGLDHETLRSKAPTATHQHAKGGLYRFLGPLMDSETKKIAVDKNGDELDAWLHVFPYTPQVWARPASERHKFTNIDQVIFRIDA